MSRHSPLARCACRDFSSWRGARGFADGHGRQLPRLTGGPFSYQTYAADTLKKSIPMAAKPMKQAVIAPSMLYPLEGQLDGYSGTTSSLAGAPGRWLKRVDLGVGWGHPMTIAASGVLRCGSGVVPASVPGRERPAAKRDRERHRLDRRRSGCSRYHRTLRRPHPTRRPPSAVHRGRR